MLVDVGAILGPVIAVRAPKPGLVGVTVVPEVAGHAVVGQEATGAAWTAEPAVAVEGLPT